MWKLTINIVQTIRSSIGGLVTELVESVLVL